MSKVVIGFTWPVIHDHLVGIIMDGKLIFAVEEERYTRKKHSVGQPPLNALKAAFKYLKQLNIKPKDVEAYAINWDPSLFLITNKYSRFLEHYFSTGMIWEENSITKVIMNVINSDIISLAKRLLKKSIIDLDEEPPNDFNVYPVPHHLAHAASAYYFSGYDSSAVITIDGTGEYEATTVWKVKHGEFEKLLSMHASYSSIGEFYEGFMVKLNLGNVLEAAGKGMGLAPYGAQSDYYFKIKKYIKITPDGDEPYNILVNGKKIVRKHNGVGLIRSIADEVINSKVKWNPRGSLNYDAANVAWAVQRLTEEMILALATWSKNQTKENNLAMAGGVALNAKANMELYYSRIFNDIFIFPAANDAGGPIGAAAYVYEHVLGGKMKNERLRNVYLGPEYTEEEIKRTIERSKLRAEYIGEDVNVVADLVANGNIVTWYQGRAELGPRALGNRSIIADPTRKEYWRIVNDIKGREWWRPLAPSLLDEDKNEYFIDPVSHEFMIMMFRFRDGMRERVPVVCHVDKTARPQTVTRDQNRTWYDLIKAFKDLKGEGLVMNTSFNLAGEPLVETPQDAIRSFAVGGFDAMYMQGWLLTKA